MVIDSAAQPITIVVTFPDGNVAVGEIKELDEHSKKVDVYTDHPERLPEVALALSEMFQSLNFMVWKTTKVLPVPDDYDPLAYDGANPPHPF